jgi:hypothetical protein
MPATLGPARRVWPVIVSVLCSGRTVLALAKILRPILLVVDLVDTSVPKTRAVQVVTACQREAVFLPRPIVLVSV